LASVFLKSYHKKSYQPMTLQAVSK